MKALQYYRLKSIANIINKLDPANTYTYDLYGRRIRKTVNGMVTNFLWDEDNISLELNENNQPIRRYVYGVGMDNVEGHFEYAEATSNPFATDHRGWYTYIKDQVGTIYKTFSHGTSQVVNSRAYDTFGNLISQSGTSKSPLGFQSKYLDPESGLYYFYHRYYSPSLGRFTTEDPIGLQGGNNLFCFVGNDSINNIDPLGFAQGYYWRHPSSYANQVYYMIYGYPKEKFEEIKTGGESSIKYVINYDWCCFLGCLKDADDIWLGGIMTISMEIFALWAVSVQPELYPVAFDISDASTAVYIIQVWDKIKECHEKCK